MKKAARLSGFFFGRGVDYLSVRLSRSIKA
jgi:hypothetical protein